MPEYTGIIDYGASDGFSQVNNLIGYFNEKAKGAVQVRRNDNKQRLKQTQVGINVTAQDNSVARVDGVLKQYLGRFVEGKGFKFTMSVSLDR